MTSNPDSGLSGVIFDMDGTVSDTWAVSLSSFRAAIAGRTPHRTLIADSTDESLVDDPCQVAGERPVINPKVA